MKKDFVLKDGCGGKVHYFHLYDKYYLIINSWNAHSGGRIMVETKKNKEYKPVDMDDKSMFIIMLRELKKIEQKLEEISAKHRRKK